MAARQNKLAPLFVLALCLLAVACSRSRYRAAADLQSNALIRSRHVDDRWVTPNRDVEPAPQSRMNLSMNLDCPAKPPDDPAASPWMYCPDGHRNIKYWQQIPDADRIENWQWLDSLPRRENGSVLLNQKTAIDLALLHSRDYQSQYEAVYLTALNLTGNQFEFQTQWNGGAGLGYTATGADLGNNRLLQVSDRLGLQRNLAGGGQVATNVLNSFFWDFGTDSFGSNGLLVTTFTQPLLRGAFRHVRLENLTQAERDLLYQVRTFARFRRQLYADVSEGYYSLLTQKQSIRNAQANIESLKSNLVEHQEMQALKMVSQIQVDQIFQEYQNGRLALLSSEQNFIASQDAFKFQLGLPPWTPFELDEELLRPFELVSAELEKLNDDSNDLYYHLLQFTPTESIDSTLATKEQLLSSWQTYIELHEKTADLLPSVQDEFDRWHVYLENQKKRTLSENDRLDIQQQLDLAKRIGAELKELENGLRDRSKFDADVKATIERYDQPESTLPAASSTDDRNAALSDPPTPKEAAWQALYYAVSGPLREEIASLYIYQTQIRLFLIDVPPIDVPTDVAVTFAHQNRLDQMNRQAQVMDAFRKIEVSADALQSSLAVNGQISLGTDPNKDNAFRIDSSANTYRAGVQFDGPLNRLNERNLYRFSQIAYQRATREYMAGKDIIANEVRAALRQIELSRLNFQIARQQLVAASRQVDQAQINIRTTKDSNTNLTRDLLQSLQGLLTAKNNLISNWVQYRVLRIRIFAILELLYMDENGNWINEEMDLAELRGLILESDYFPESVLQQAGARDGAAEIVVAPYDGPFPSSGIGSGGPDSPILEEDGSYTTVISVAPQLDIR